MNEQEVKEKIVENLNRQISDLQGESQQLKNQYNSFTAILDEIQIKKDKCKKEFNEKLRAIQKKKLELQMLLDEFKLPAYYQISENVIIGIFEKENSDPHFLGKHSFIGIYVCCASDNLSIKKQIVQQKEFVNFESISKEEYDNVYVFVVTQLSNIKQGE